MSQPLRVGGVPEPFNLPWRLAAADNAFADGGVPIDYVDVAAGTGELTRALRDSELDVALVLTEGAVADIVRHDANRLVKTFVKSPLIWGIHVAADSAINDTAETRGSRIAISRYLSGSHLVAVLDAAARGWPTDNLSFVVINSIDGAREALASRRADTFLWERHVTQPLVDSGEFRRIGQRAVPWPAFSVSVRRRLADERPEDLRTALDIVAQYARRLRRRRSAVGEICNAYGMSPVDAERWLRSVRWGNDYRRPSGALSRVVSALESLQLIESGQADLDRIWHAI